MVTKTQSAPSKPLSVASDGYETARITATEYEPRMLGELRAHLEELVYRATGQRRVILAHTVIVDFFDGDHNAAILLNQMLYWTSRAASEDGWFYKTYAQWHDELRFSEYQVRRVVQGDPRVKKFKRTLWSLGLETQVRMATNGRNATFYRLNLSALFTAFIEWAEQRFGVSLDREPTPEPTTFTEYTRFFGKLKRNVESLLDEARQQLGDAAIHRVIQRCVGRGNSWSYVVAAVTNELAAAQQPTPPVNVAPPTPDPEPLDETIEQLWATENVTPAVQAAWRRVMDRLRAEMGFFDHHLTFQGHQLVDFGENTFVVALEAQHMVDWVHDRYKALIDRIAAETLSEVAHIRGVTQEEWRGQQQNE